VTRLRDELIPPAAGEILLSQKRPDQLCGPFSHLFKGYQKCFPWSVKLVTNLNLALRLRKKWCFSSAVPSYKNVFIACIGTVTCVIFTLVISI
jgi:hypothetical protein